MIRQDKAAEMVKHYSDSQTTNVKEMFAKKMKRSLRKKI
jgi:hypothetical protein